MKAITQKSKAGSTSLLAGKLFLILILLSVQSSYAQSSIIGTWTVQDEGMRRSVTLSQDGTGMFVRGEKSFEILSYQVIECEIEDQYMIDMVVSTDAGDDDLLTLFNLHDPDNIRMNTFPDNASRSAFNEEYYSEGVQLIKE